MLKLFIGTALLYLPIAIPCCILCFGVVRRSLQQKDRIVRIVARAGFLLCLAVLTAGMIYGALRFSGAIMFATDNQISHNWFSASWRDDGFKYLYGCGTVFAGFVTAFLLERRNAKKQN